MAQWVKRWLTHVPVQDLNPAGGGILPSVNGIPLHMTFHLLFVLWKKGRN